MKQHFSTYEEKVIYEKLKSIEDTVRIEQNDDLYLIEEKLRHISDHIETMQRASCFEYYSQVESNKKRIGWAVVKAKNLIRKTLAFIFGPMLAQQAEYNTHASASAAAMAEIFELEARESRKIKKKLDEMMECLTYLMEKKAREQSEELKKEKNLICKRMDMLEEKLSVMIEKADKEQL